MASLDALFSVGVPMLTGHLQGQAQGHQLLYERQREEEDRRRKAELDALQMQILQANLNKSQNPPTPWEAQGFGTKEEHLGYLGELERLQNQPRTPWEQSGFTHEQSYLDYLQRKKEAEAAPVRTPWEDAGFDSQESYLEYLDREGRAKYPERYDDAGSGPFGPEQRNKFLWEYMLKTNEGRMDPLTFEYQAPPPPEERIRAAQKAWEEMVRLGRDPNEIPAGGDLEAELDAEYSDGYNPADEIPAGSGGGDTLFSLEGTLRRSGLLKPDTIGPVPLPPESLPPVPPAPPAPGARPVPEPAKAPRAHTLNVQGRIEQLKALRVSKEEAFRILQAEGYIDSQGNVIGDQ